MKMRRLCILAVSLAVLLCGIAYGEAGAQGEATLGTDQRGRQASDDFGFAFMDNVQRPQNPDDPAQRTTSYTDTCRTLPKRQGDVLTATDGVASPDYPEVIRHECSGDTVTFEGRTGDCYYMVTGTISRAGSGGSGGDKATFDSDFDTNDRQDPSPHFVVYLNERYSSVDDFFMTDEITMVSIEVANPTGIETVSFRLSQKAIDSAEQGSVVILQEDGVTPEPISEDGKTQRIYCIQPLPEATGRVEPNGGAVQVKVRGVTEGVVSIIAEDIASEID